LKVTARTLYAFDQILLDTAKGIFERGVDTPLVLLKGSRCRRWLGHANQKKHTKRLFFESWTLNIIASA
jgi:hypothetical protein